MAKTNLRKVETFTWGHDAPTNSVNFVGSAVPQANQTIEVTYTVACLP